MTQKMMADIMKMRLKMEKIAIYGKFISDNLTEQFLKEGWEEECVVIKFISHNDIMPILKKKILIGGIEAYLGFIPKWFTFGLFCKKETEKEVFEKLKKGFDEFLKVNESYFGYDKGHNNLSHIGDIDETKLALIKEDLEIDSIGIEYEWVYNVFKIFDKKFDDVKDDLKDKYQKLEGFIKSNKEGN
ncbi:MAG: hypothetical protein LBN20_01440 [Endomicrobium sp.]|jgi:hypothetical protein|nr:hypothetical protein [Endomicrobium sp.]